MTPFLATLRSSADAELRRLADRLNALNDELGIAEAKRDHAWASAVQDHMRKINEDTDTIERTLERIE